MIHTQNAYATFPGANGKIAFVSERDGNREIYTMNPDVSSQTRLTNNATQDEAPAWSPDNTKIVFDREGPGYSNIYVMNADGTGVKALTNDAESNNNMHFSNFDFDPSWSPDGTKIAFDRLNNGVRTIWVMNSDGSGVKSLSGAITHNFSPRWAPDGKKIAFFANTGIYVMNEDGSSKTQLVSSGAYPDWSPDGKQIAFSFNGTISVMNSNGTAVTMVPNLSGGEYPRWAPDGTKLVFSKSDGIYTINKDGSDLVRIDNESSVFYFGFPDWGRATLTTTLQTVRSQDTNGNPISGYWTVLYDGTNGGNVLKTGFTPAKFTLNSGQQYKIGMGNFGRYSFDHWLDNNSTANPRSVSINGSDTQLTAVYKASVTYPVTHMSDTTATTGYGVHAPKPARAEYVTSTSQLVGNKIDSITLKLKRVGTISGTAEIGILDSNNAVKKSFGTLNVATLTTAYKDYEFHLSNNELYAIQAGDRIGIKYTGGDANNNWVSVMLDQNAADPFDGVNSYNQYYQSGKWLDHTDWDMYMLLKQTHA